MSERTDTHTALDLPELSMARPVIGVVVAFSEGVPALRAVAVEARVRIGREPALELSVDDGKASRCHAEFLPGGAGVLVTDLESRNGTFLDGEPLSSPGAVAKVGSIVRVGRTVLIVVANVQPHLREPSDDPLLIGGPALDETRQVIAVVAPSRVPVLVEGETGTGKELVAQAIHRGSNRRGELCAINCAALPGELVESGLSATPAAPSRRPPAPARACSEPPTAARSFWTRSATFRWRLRPSSCGCSRAGRSARSAKTTRSGSTCGSSRRPTAISIA